MSASAHRIGHALAAGVTPAAQYPDANVAKSVNSADDAARE
jgi:hypothetical protein